MVNLIAHPTTPKQATLWDRLIGSPYLPIKLHRASADKYRIDLDRLSQMQRSRLASWLSKHYDIPYDVAFSVHLHRPIISAEKVIVAPANVTIDNAAQPTYTDSHMWVK